MKAIKAEESIGQKYGKLTVLRFVGEHITPNGRKFKQVECQCECGQSKTANLQDIRSGKTKTCGLNHPHYEDRTRPAFNQLYNHSYKKRALDKGLSFELTEDQFRELTQMNCHYCGIDPNSNLMRCYYPNQKVVKNEARTRSGHYISSYKYNGIDRKDNSLGYVMDNVVPCCGICNHAKHSMSYEDFQEWIGSLIRHKASLI